MYIYPENLKSKAMLWFWELKDIGIIGVALVISVAILTQLKFVVPLVITAAYAFLTIRFEDMSILQFIHNAYNYFFGTRQRYEWRLNHD